MKNRWRNCLILFFILMFVGNTGVTVMQVKEFRQSEKTKNRAEELVNLQIPDVQIIKALMNEYGSLKSCMTGSGSAVFGIFNDEIKAQGAYEILKNYGDVFITKPMNKI